MEQIMKYFIFLLTVSVGFAAGNGPYPVPGGGSGGATGTAWLGFTPRLWDHFWQFLPAVTDTNSVPLQVYATNDFAARIHSDTSIGAYISSLGGIPLKAIQGGWVSSVGKDAPVQYIWRAAGNIYSNASPALTINDYGDSSLYTGPYIHIVGSTNGQGTNPVTMDIVRSGSILTSGNLKYATPVLDFNCSEQYINASITLTSSTNTAPLNSIRIVYVTVVGSAIAITFPVANGSTDNNGVKWQAKTTGAAANLANQVVTFKSINYNGVQTMLVNW